MQNRENPPEEDLNALPELPDIEPVSEPLPAIPVKMPLLPAPVGLSGKDILTHYLSQLRHYPILTPGEEKECAKAYYERGDRNAGERLVTSNLRLVVKLAFQYHRQWSNVLDLIQEGNVGLVQALYKYDPDRGIRFSSYAQYWIRAMILRFLMDNFRLVRLGSTRAARQLFFQLRKEREQLLREGLNPQPKLLAERLSVSESEILAVDRHLRAPALSLQSPVSEDDKRQLSDIMADEDAVNPEQVTMRTQFQDVLKAALNKFENTLEDDRERAIWRDRLLSQDPVSLSVLGERFAISKERIRQIESKIRLQLRGFLRRELGDDVALDVLSPSS
jgi:RNA polymerase sigma-32 factor